MELGRDAALLLLKAQTSKDSSKRRTTALFFCCRQGRGGPVSASAARACCSARASAAASGTLLLLEALLSRLPLSTLPSSSPPSSVVNDDVPLLLLPPTENTEWRPEPLDEDSPSAGGSTEEGDNAPLRLLLASASAACRPAAVAVSGEASSLSATSRTQPSLVAASASCAAHIPRAPHETGRALCVLNTAVASPARLRLRSSLPAFAAPACTSFRMPEPCTSTLSSSLLRCGRSSLARLLAASASAALTPLGAAELSDAGAAAAAVETRAAKRSVTDACGVQQWREWRAVDSESRAAWR